MRLCLELAEKGKFFVKANPMVGAVLVDRDGNILSKGYHKAFGKEHAEVSALKKWKEVPKNSLDSKTIKLDATKQTQTKILIKTILKTRL